MSKYLSSNQLNKINQWLEEIQTSPFLLHPLHGAVQEVFHEAPANIRDLQVPTYNFKRATEKRSVGKWKSQYVAKSSREKLRPEDYQIRIYCERLGLDQALRRELNTVASMSSLPHAETNELVTDSRTVVKGEFVRVLQIRNSFYAEQQLYAALLCQRELSPEVTIFYEMRQSECAYGCDKAQEAAQYIQAYASTEKMSIDFEVLLSVLPYPEIVEEADTFLTTSSSSGSSTDVTSSTTMVSSSGKGAHLRKEAISDADFNNWKDRWIFQISHRSIRHPGTL